MGADIPALVRAVAGDALVIAGEAADTWLALIAGDEARAGELRAALRVKAPELASAVTWVAVERVGEGLAEAARALPAAQPAVALERIVAAAWHEALGVPPASVDEDFFAAGGHSLLAGEVAARLEQVLEVDVPLGMVFDYPTVREQAAWLATVVAASHARGLPWRRGIDARVVVARGAVDATALAVVAARDSGAVGELVDLSGVRGGARREAWTRVVEAARARVARQAGWHATPVRFAPARHAIVLAFDHARLDGDSAAQIVADIVEAHVAAREARSPLWPAREPVDVDVVGDVDGDGDGDGDVDVRRAAATAHVVPARIARVVADVARQQSTDADTALLALVAATLAEPHRPSVTLALPASTRIGPASRGSLGAHTALAPVVIDLSGDPSFVTLVDRARVAIPRAWAAAAGLVDGARARVDARVDIVVDPPATSRTTSRGHGNRAPHGSDDVVASTPETSLARPWRRGGLASKERPSADLHAHDRPDHTLVLRGPLAARVATLLAAIAARPTTSLATLAGHAAADTTAATAAPAISAPLPLTHAQERLWFLETLSPGTATNHIQRVYRVDGPLDAPTLARALTALQIRHPALRTIFRTHDGAASQLVVRDMPLDHRVDPDATEPDIIAAAAADHARPFALDTGPLWRTRVLALGPGRHVLVLTIHHLIADALSVIVWLRELAEHHHAIAHGTVPRVPELTTSLPDIAAWERSPAGRARGDADLAFWLDRLAGARPLDLPLDFRRPRADSLGRYEIHELLSAERAAELRAVGRRFGATLNTLLLTAAAAFLARLAGRDELVCVVPAARRDEPGREAVIGLLLNLLPLRLHLDGDPTFGELIQRASRALREAIAHAESPYERIVAALGLPREPGRQPLLDVIVNMVPGTELTRRGDLRFTIDTFSNSAQPCDMVIGATTRPGGILDLMIRVRADLFAEATAQRMMERFATLLAAAAAAPNLPLSELPVMPAAERELVVSTWNATDMPLPDTTVHALVAEQLARDPDAIAVVPDLTRGELARGAVRFARGLAIAPGTPVGVAIPPGPELAIAALGVMMAGGVYVPFDTTQPAARLDQLAAEVARVVTRADATGDHPLPDVAADAPAYIVFTSGSTGRPKGVVTSHRALVNQILWFRRDLPWRANEVSCMRSSPAFVDSLWELFGPLADGVPLAIASIDEMKDPRLLAAMAARHRVTRMVVVPSLLRTLLELQAPLPDLTLWLATSEELTPAVVRAFRAARPTDRLVNLYGASETADQVAAYDVQDPEARTPIGKPIANSRIYVVDEHRAPVPIGVAGELCIAGVGLSRYTTPRGPVPAGGERKSNHDGERFTYAAGERVYRTGDRGRWRHDGVLEYLGRLDHVLKIRGVRVDPAEVEAAILAHGEIGDAVVTAQPGFDGESRLVAHVVGKLDPAELRRRLRARLPETMIPTAFVAMPALPLGPTGKVDRAALPEAIAVAAPSRAPETATEHAVALAWEQLLGIPVGAENDFFAAGGQSLVAAQLGARLAERFGVELPLPVLFERPTVAAQAAWIDDAIRTAGATTIPHADEPAPLSFAQERLMFAMQLAPGAPAPKLRGALRLEGPLDRKRLEAALVAVAERQSALRTVFADGRQRVAQVARVHQDIAIDAPFDDEIVKAHLDDERELPFDLAGGPPWRTRLLRFSPTDHVLLVTMHHLVTDGISLAIWRDDLHELYGGHDLPPLAASAADVARWQRRTADAPVSRRFWRDALAGATPIDLPLAAPRTAWSDGRGGRVRADLSEEDAAAVSALARAEHTSVFGVLVAGAAAWLHGLTGRDDLVIGTIAAGRDRPEVRPLIGLFLNPLPLRVDAAGDPSLRELVRRAGATTRDALAHGDVPFERIVADVNPERRPFRQPLFDIVLNHHPLGDPPRLGDLAVKHVRGVTAPVAPYELMIRTIARKGLVIQLDFQRDRFAEATVEAWLARYVDALRAIIAEPDRTMSSLRA